MSETKDFYEELFECFKEDFTAMEGCKTNGELADWFISYIDNKGCGGLEDILNGKEDPSEWIQDNGFNAILPWIIDVKSGKMDANAIIEKAVLRNMECEFACEEYENGSEFFNKCVKADSTDDVKTYGALRKDLEDFARTKDPSKIGGLAKDLQNYEIQANEFLENGEYDSVSDWEMALRDDIRGVIQWLDEKDHEVFDFMRLKEMEAARELEQDER